MSSTIGIIVRLLLAIAGAGFGPVAAMGQALGDSARTSAVDSARLRVFPLPVVFYTPETRFAGGASALITHRQPGAERSTAASITAIYTQNRQAIGEFSVEGYPGGGAYHYGGYGAHQRFPDVAYALGNRSDPDDREEYTHVGTSLIVDLDRRVAPGVYVGGGLRVSRDELTDLAGGGPISSGALPGAAGGTTWGAGARVTVDTRDHVFIPSGGALVTLDVRAHPEALGGDYAFARYSLDGRRYLLLGSAVLGFQALLSGTAGEAPFRSLPALGGQNLLRGYYGGRFRDRNMAVLQSEYRLPVHKRFGLVAFAGTGQVSSELSAMRLDGFHAAGGLGFRFLLDPREGVNLRIDYGLGEGGASGLYITVTEAF